MGTETLSGDDEMERAVVDTGNGEGRQIREITVAYPDQC